MTAEASFKGAWSLVQSGIGSLDWQHWFWATIAGLVAIALNSVMNFTALPAPSNFDWYVNLGLMLVTAWLILPSVAIADRLPMTLPRPPVLRYLVVVLVVAILAGFAFPRLRNDLVPALLILFNQAVPELPAVGHGRIFSIWTAVNAFMFGGLATFFWLRLRGARRTERALADAQLAAAEASRNVVTSRLQAAQAQVDPQLLFDVLDRAEALYESDHMAATVLIDDLIAYLRAAMPRMRDTSSTLAQEIELARAYLAIVKVRFGDRLTYMIDVAEDIGNARMPPMMLLPLIDHALVCGVEPSRTGGSITISASVDGGNLTLTVGNSDLSFVPGAPGADPMQSIRDRLSALYGEQGRLELLRVDQQITEAVIEIPYEQAATAVA